MVTMLVQNDMKKKMNAKHAVKAEISMKTKSFNLAESLALSTS